MDKGNKQPKQPKIADLIKLEAEIEQERKELSLERFGHENATWPELLKPGRKPRR